MTQSDSQLLICDNQEEKYGTFSNKNFFIQSDNGWSDESEDQEISAIKDNKVMVVDVPIRIALRDPRCKKYVNPHTREISYRRKTRMISNNRKKWKPLYLFGGVKNSTTGKINIYYATAISNAAFPGLTFFSAIALLSVAEIGIFFYSCYGSKSFSQPDLRLLVRFGNNRAAILKGELYRLVTPIFLHSNYFHLAVNVINQLALGSDIEYSVGSLWFLFIYFVGGIWGNLFSACRIRNTLSISIGASTSGMALVGFRLMDYAVTWQSIANRFRLQLLLECLINLILLIAQGFLINVDHWGHLGGGLAGLCLAPFFTAASKRPESHPQYILVSILILIGSILYCCFNLLSVAEIVSLATKI